VIREVWEETGVLVEPIRLIGLYSGPEYRFTFANNDEVEAFPALYLCRAIGGTPEPDGHESLAAAYFAPESLDFLSERWQQRVADALADHPTARFQPSTWQP
jgi:8-oxo-dGTP pyrophosphatase MutT (NUDIX family)